MNYESLMMSIMELQSRIQGVEVSISSLSSDEFYEDPPSIPNRQDDWAYRVSVSDRLKIKVSPGSRVVIHKSVDNDGEQIIPVSPGTTTELYAVYNYTTESSAGSWDGPPTTGTPPGEDATRRVFRIATIVTHSTGIASIKHHHCGNLEVYDLVQC